MKKYSQIHFNCTGNPITNKKKIDAVNFIVYNRDIKKPKYIIVYF